jgi:hypothetical protein
MLASMSNRGTINNIWTMPASAVVSIPSALNNPNISWITQIKQPESIKPPTVPSLIRVDANATTQNTYLQGVQNENYHIEFVSTFIRVFL